MTNQEAFNKIWERAKDHRQALSSLGDSCMYRADDGLCCFVGVLIPEDEYLEQFEGRAAMWVQGLVPALAGISVKLLVQAQDIHDLCPPQNWAVRLGKLGAELGLEVPND